MTYSLSVREAFNPDGASFDIASAVINGQHYEARSRHGATSKLARKMLADGLPDGPWQVLGSDGRVRYYGPALRRLARLSVHETDKHGPRFVRHRPMSDPPVVSLVPVMEAAQCPLPAHDSAPSDAIVNG